MWLLKDSQFTPTVQNVYTNTHTHTNKHEVANTFPNSRNLMILMNYTWLLRDVLPVTGGKQTTIDTRGANVLIVANLSEDCSVGNASCEAHHICASAGLIQQDHASFKFVASHEAA
jgi:hypothetical protein